MSPQKLRFALLAIIIVGLAAAIYSYNAASPANEPIVPPIPIPKGNEKTIALGINGREGSFVVSQIDEDSVTGMWHEVTPIAMEDEKDTQRTLHVGDDIGVPCMGTKIILKKINFDEQIAIFSKTEDPQPGGCPVCLSGDTNIDTPGGPIPVRDIRKGTLVWTRDESGNQISAPVINTRRMEVPMTHSVIRVTLEDGRTVTASSPHPTTDQRAFGELAVGDILDDSRIIHIETIPYDQKYTYDILPQSSTGYYWANGVLIGSTIE